MSTLRSVSFALGALAFAATCAVCSINGLKSVALAGPPTSLLFVSDPHVNEIAVFSLPDLTIVKVPIKGLDQPHGLCSDDSGNIWVANTTAQRMKLYSRAGKLITKLKDPDGYPFACSVDPNLAVANIYNKVHDMSGPGETEIYINSAGIPTSYDPPTVYSVHGVAYDPVGDVYIDGLTKAGTFVLAVLRAGSKAVQQISITGPVIHYPGMVQWDEDDHYLAVGDRRCDTPRTTCIYHVKISGLTGTIIGKTTFKAHNGHVICDMAQGVIATQGPKFLAGGDDESSCRYAKSSVDRWAYPAGGLPTNYIHSTLTRPFGTAISAK